MLLVRTQPLAETEARKQVFSFLTICSYSQAIFTVLVENNLILLDKWKKNKPYKPKLTLLGIYPRDPNVYEKTWTRMFKTAFPEVEKIQLKYP